MSSSAVLPSIGGYTISGGTDLWRGDFGKRLPVSLAFWLGFPLGAFRYKYGDNIAASEPSGEK